MHNVDRGKLFKIITKSIKLLQLSLAYLQDVVHVRAQNQFKFTCSNSIGAFDTCTHVMDT